jgi:hypothetical protein
MGKAYPDARSVSPELVVEEGYLSHIATRDTGSPGGMLAYDHCYHQACDTINNLNRMGFDEMSDAAVTALTQLALFGGSARNGPGSGARPCWRSE